MSFAGTSVGAELSWDLIAHVDLAPVDSLRSSTPRVAVAPSPGNTLRNVAEAHRRGARVGRRGDDVRGPVAVEVDAPINQQEVAKWAGMSREAVAKGRRQLRGLGWLTVDARVLTLLDPQAIRRRAGQR
ncbi:MAG: helix-turn-helix domain-containing protein [Acidimicrobiales bacterium]